MASCDTLAVMPIRLSASYISPSRSSTVTFKSVLLLISFFICGASAFKNPGASTLHSVATFPKMPAKTESSVLGELKATIRLQKAEIEKLQQQLKQQAPAKSSASHGGHGGGEVSEEDIAGYLEEPFYTTSFKRVGWLGIFLASLSFTAIIMNNFEHTLEKHIELSYFVPLLAGHGGNTGGQAVGTVLSALSAGTVTKQDVTRVVFKEFMAGVLSGTILGLVVGPVAYKVMGISYPVTTVLFFTMPLLSTIAAGLGALIPFICIWCGLDPSVIAAPAMTSLVDVSGLLSYFVIANQVFKLFGLEF